MQIKGKQINLSTLVGPGLTTGITHDIHNGAPMDASLFDTIRLDPDANLPLLKVCPCQEEEKMEVCDNCRGAGLVPTQMGKSILELLAVRQYLDMTGAECDR